MYVIMYVLVHVCMCLCVCACACACVCVLGRLKVVVVGDTRVYMTGVNKEMKNYC